MKRQVNALESIDWLTVIIYLMLVTFGWLNIFAVNHDASDTYFWDKDNRYSIQLIFIFISLGLALLIFVLDSRFFSFAAYPLYGTGLFLLLLVLVVGTAVHGSRSWISLGPVNLQPSEFAKVTTLLALARFLSSYNVKISRGRDLLITFGILALPIGLIMLQPDFGSTIVYGIMLLVLYREGLPGWVLILILSLVILFLGTLILPQMIVLSILLGLFLLAMPVAARKPLVFFIGAAIVGLGIGLGILLARFGVIDQERVLFLLMAIGIAFLAALIYSLVVKYRELYIVLGFFLLSVAFTYSVDFVFHNLMKEHQQNRVNVMLGLESDPYGYEYNVRQSKIAIGSGGFSGKGFMQGTQTKFRFVPEQSTDFIFCTVGEEWGFLGSFGLVILYMGMLIRILFLAERQRSSFNRIYGYGVASILFFHFAVNIGMTIGLFPVIGIPLPFLSYGGSSLLAFTILIFIFIKLDSARKTHLV